MSDVDDLGSLPWPAVQFHPDAFTKLVAPDCFVDLLAEHERALREQLRAAYARELDERRAEETRHYWSGPDKFDRQRVPAQAAGPGEAEAAVSEHPAVVFLLEALDKAEQEADRLHTELWWVGMVDRIEVYDTDGRRVPEIAVHSQGELRLIPTTEAIQRALLVGNPTDLTRRARLARETLAEHARADAGDGLRYDNECRTCCGPSPHLSGVWPVAYPCNTVLITAQAWGWEQP